MSVLGTANCYSSLVLLQSSQHRTGYSPLEYEGREHTLTISIGLAEALLDDDPASLLKRSDSALYAAKEAGRNRRYCGIPTATR